MQGTTQIVLHRGKGLAIIPCMVLYSLVIG